MDDRVVFTPSAADLVGRLKARHGPLIFHLSGGRCEGTAPMCFASADFRTGSLDVLLGTIEGLSVLHRRPTAGALGRYAVRHRRRPLRERQLLARSRRLIAAPASTEMMVHSAQSSFRVELPAAEHRRYRDREPGLNGDGSAAIGTIHGCA